MGRSPAAEMVLAASRSTDPRRPVHLLVAYAVENDLLHATQGGEVRWDENQGLLVGNDLVPDPTKLQARVTAEKRLRQALALLGVRAHRVKCAGGNHTVLQVGEFIVLPDHPIDRADEELYALADNESCYARARSLKNGGG